MKQLSAAVAVAAAVLVSLAMVGAGAGATTAAKGGNNPVKLTGKVNVAGTATATGGAVAIQMTDFAFNPTFVKVPSGTTSITVSLTNNGQHQHTFTMPSQSVDQVLNPGQSATVTVTVPKSGAVMFYCRFHKQLGMQGAFFTKKGAKLVASVSAGAGAGATPTTKAPSSSSSSGSSGYGY
jgi:plastocyanin